MTKPYAWPYVVGKPRWTKRQRAQLQTQPTQSQRRMVSDASHYFLGQRYRLRVIEEGGSHRLPLRGKASMLLTVRSDTTPEKKQEIHHTLCRAELKKLVSELLDKWQPILGGYGQRLGYQAHEDQMTHLLERHHNERFTGLLDQHLPQWRPLREELNGLVLAEF